MFKGCVLALLFKMPRGMGVPRMQAPLLQIQHWQTSVRRVNQTTGQDQPGVRRAEGEQARWALHPTAGHFLQDAGTQVQLERQGLGPASMTAARPPSNPAPHSSSPFVQGGMSSNIALWAQGGRGLHHQIHGQQGGRLWDPAMTSRAAFLKQHEKNCFFPARGTPWGTPKSLEREQ